MFYIRSPFLVKRDGGHRDELIVDDQAAETVDLGGMARQQQGGSVELRQDRRAGDAVAGAEPGAIVDRGRRPCRTGFDEFELGELFAERTQGRTDPDGAQSHPRTRSRSRATYGCSAVIDCSAATAQWRPTLRACSVASRRT
jgi:hypothetical protein